MCINTELMLLKLPGFFPGTTLVEETVIKVY